MATTQRPQGDDDANKWLSDGQEPRLPDEDGPHDVPDDKVIERTLPSKPSRDDDPSPT
jgi:hypothetical protein